MQLYSRNVWKSNHLLRDAFQPKSTAGSLEFPSIVTTSPKTDWYSPGAQQHMTPSADVVLLWRAFDIGDFRQVRKAWLAGIFNVHCRIILRQGDVANPKYYIAGHAFPDSCVLAWQGSMHKFPGTHDTYYFTPMSEGQCSLLAVFDLGEVAGVSIKT